MAKIITRYVCRACAFETPKWLGKCPGCEEWGTLDEVSMAVSKSTPGSAPGRFLRSSAAAPVSQRLSEILSPDQEGRISTGSSEFDRVLGGGIVAGSLVLVGGDPGIGKSTLLTQMAGAAATNGIDVLYISGEESSAQIKRRAVRLGIPQDHSLFLLNESDINLIEAAINALSDASIVIVDSIQTMRHPDVESAQGGVWQVRACTAVLNDIAKRTGIPIFLVGHVTKEGNLAGPRVLEHMVDTVLHFEGDRHSFYRVLRAGKNRFGPSDEMGIFEMREDGLTAVENPSALLLSERPDNAPGSAVTCIMEGSRPLLIEVQALISASSLPSPRRSVTGIDQNRIHMILAVLDTCAKIRLGTSDVFVNVAGGIKVTETSADLGASLAVASQFKRIPLDQRTIAIGEIGLAGEVRAVPNIEKRLRESARLGFKRALIAKRNQASLTINDPALKGLEIVGVDTVASAISQALS